MGEKGMMGSSGLNRKEPIMTQLRDRMIQDMRLRNLRPGTQQACVRAVIGLCQYYHTQTPQTLRPEQVREYLGAGKRYSRTESVRAHPA